MDPMNDAALEREIERALAVDPSPEFVARVRTRIAEEPSRVSRGFGWLFAGVTAAAVAAGVVALVMLRPDRRVGSEIGPLVSRSINSVVVVPALSRGLGGEHRTTYVERRTANDAPRTTRVRTALRPARDDGAAASDRRRARRARRPFPVAEGTDVGAYDASTD